MLKDYKKLLFLNFMYILIFSCLTGCSKNHNSIVNTSDLSKLMHTDNIADSHETVKLDNGVIIYKDNINSRSPSGYSEFKFSPVKRISFGPKNLEFAPANPK